MINGKHSELQFYAKNMIRNADNQFSAAVGALNALRAMVVQPQLDRQFEVHFRGRHSHQVHQPYRR